MNVDPPKKKTGGPKKKGPRNGAFESGSSIDFADEGGDETLSGAQVQDVMNKNFKLLGGAAGGGAAGAQREEAGPGVPDPRHQRQGLLRQGQRRDRLHGGQLRVRQDAGGGLSQFQRSQDPRHLLSGAALEIDLHLHPRLVPRRRRVLPKEGEVVALDLQRVLPEVEVQAAAGLALQEEGRVCGAVGAQLAVASDDLEGDREQKARLRVEAEGGAGVLAQAILVRGVRTVHGAVEEL